MKLQVEYYRDQETGKWGFDVPALDIVGGGDDTRPEAEKHCLEAIAFTLESGLVGTPAPEGEVVDYSVQLTPL